MESGLLLYRNLILLIEKLKELRNNGDTDNKPIHDQVAIAAAPAIFPNISDREKCISGDVLAKLWGSEDWTNRAMAIFR